MSREDAGRLRTQTERLRGERTSLQQRLCDLESALTESQEESRRLGDLMKREREQWAQDHAAGKQLATELAKEVDMLRSAVSSSSAQRHQQLSGSINDCSPAAGRINELENEIKSLKQQNNGEMRTNLEIGMIAG